MVNSREDLTDNDEEDKEDRDSSLKVGAPKRMPTIIDREWFDKNIMDKFAVKKKNYNIFSCRLVTQKSLSTNLKEHRINRALNEYLAKMDLTCSNNLDENFIKNDMV